MTALKSLTQAVCTILDPIIKPLEKEEQQELLLEIARHFGIGMGGADPVSHNGQYDEQLIKKLLEDKRLHELILVMVEGRDALLKGEAGKAPKPEKRQKATRKSVVQGLKQRSQGEPLDEKSLKTLVTAYDGADTESLADLKFNLMLKLFFFQPNQLQAIIAGQKSDLDLEQCALSGYHFPEVLRPLLERYLAMIPNQDALFLTQQGTPYKMNSFISFLRLASERLISKPITPRTFSNSALKWLVDHLGEEATAVLQQATAVPAGIMASLNKAATEFLA